MAADANYQVIGDQVFRLEYTFLTQTSPTSSLTFPTSQTTTLAYYTDTPSCGGAGHERRLGLKDVTAIVVTIAVLDTHQPRHRRQHGAIPDRSLLSRRTSGFTAATTSKTAATSTVLHCSLIAWKNDLAGTWKTKLRHHANLGLPVAAASQVRFYQRYCYLNHLQ